MAQRIRTRIISVVIGTIRLTIISMEKSISMVISMMTILIVICNIYKENRDYKLKVGSTAGYVKKIYTPIRLYKVFNIFIFTFLDHFDSLDISSVGQLYVKCGMICKHNYIAYGMVSWSRISGI